MLDNRRRANGRVRNALAASLMLHAAVVAFAVVAEGSAPRPPKTRVYAVDIVSPPPNVAGEPPREALSNQEPGPAAAATPQPAAAQPAPAEPDPPAPDPEPAPPRDEAPKEPAKAPEPRRTPERPPQRPATTPVERPKQNTPPRTTPTRPATTPATNTNRPTTPEKNRPTTNRPASGTSGQSGTGSGPNRTRGDGTSTAAATGSNPQAGSLGGEGLNIHVEGDPCPVAGYCERVTIQVQRFFRAPPDNTGARGEVCFRIQRDGSVTDIQAQRVRGGGAAFRLAMMEAAEAAGSRRAFGTLPAAFDPQRWRWCVELSPR
jgi:outer membrane biosynthesis protein TonB